VTPTGQGTQPPTAGGNGIASSINGTATTYAIGGQGGGSVTASALTTAGANGTGGGGGGGRGQSSSNGFAGGSGIVIIRYRIA
jgi:hypothetical protein